LAVPEKVRQILQLDPSETEIVEIKRRRHISGEPFSFTINYLPVAIGKRVDAAALYSVPLIGRDFRRGRHR
jgi:DNA-binding GntR family transcriptional regulator